MNTFGICRAGNQHRSVHPSERTVHGWSTNIRLLTVSDRCERKGSFTVWEKLASTNKTQLENDENSVNAHGQQSRPSQCLKWSQNTVKVSEMSWGHERTSKQRSLLSLTSKTPQSTPPAGCNERTRGQRAGKAGERWHHLPCEAQWVGCPSSPSNYKVTVNQAPNTEINPYHALRRCWPRLVVGSHSQK